MAERDPRWSEQEIDEMTSNQPSGSEIKSALHLIYEGSPELWWMINDSDVESRKTKEKEES